MAVDVGAVGQETAVRSCGRPAVRLPRADACADEGEEHAEDERNPEHVELLLFGPLGAADRTPSCVSPQRGKCRLQERLQRRLEALQIRHVGDKRGDSVRPDGTVRFRVLGALEVEVDGVAAELGGARQRTVLAVLLMHANEPVATDRLVSESWGEPLRPRPPRRRRSMFAASLSARKRHAHTTPGGYLLRVPPGALDTDEVDELRGRAREAGSARGGQAASQGLALWRGPPYADLRYETALQPEIRRLEELRLTTLEERIEADLAGGEASQLVPELEALVAEHPLRERLRAFLMLALYRSGRQAEALETYREGRQLLDNELGLEPGVELRELERAILAHDSALEGPQRAIRRTARRRSGALLAAGGVLLLAAALAAVGGSFGSAAAASPTGGAGAEALDGADGKAAGERHSRHGSLERGRRGGGGLGARRRRQDDLEDRPGYAVR